MFLFLSISVSASTYILFTFILYLTNAFNDIRGGAGDSFDSEKRENNGNQKEVVRPSSTNILSLVNSNQEVFYHQVLLNLV